MSLGARSMLRLALFGAGAAAFQTLFAREFFAAFSGNEAVLAAVLGPWFLLTAAGAFAARRHASRERVSWLLASYGPIAAATVAGARLLPRAFELGSSPGPSAAFGWAVLLLAPACLSSGLLFGYLAGAGKDPGSAGRAYLAESLGSALAGAALSLVLLGRAPAFSVLAGVVVLSGWAAALGLSRWRMPAMALAVAAGLPLALLPLDRWTAQAQTPELEVRSRLDSPYGAIVVGGRPGEASVFVDRRPVATAIDAAGAEEAAHLPLALHPSPRTVAVVGVAPVGTARALLQHGVERIDYLLEDQRLADALAAEYPDFSAPGVRLVGADPRRHLFDHPDLYDAVLVISSEPTSAKLNRAFTAEFYASAARSLRPGGLLAVSLPGHAAYASEETRRLHSSIRRTLESSLGAPRVFPLQRTLYLTAKSRSLPEASSAAAGISGVLESRGIAPKHLTRAALGQLLSAPRCADATRWAALDEPVNRDLHPTTYRLALDKVVSQFADLGTGALAFVAGALAIAAALLFGPRARPVQFAVLTSGLTSLAMQLLLMLGYQIATGALYRELGLILAGFMAGAAVGAAAGGRLGAPRRLVLGLDLAQLGLPIALWLALPPSISGTLGPARATLFALTALAGLLPGAQFAAAARACGARPGALYAADLLGAAIAALLTFTVIVPAWGVGGALLALAALKAASTIALLLPERGAAAAIRPVSLAPLLPFALFAFVILAAADGSEPPLYAFTFRRWYQALAVAVLLLGALAAFEPASLRAAVLRVSRRLARWREQAGATAGRLLHFGLLLPVAAFPIARCYFKVPFVFCHVCPRQCVFGVLRPYAVPAAVLANLQGHRFCERMCPLGTAQGACERLAGHRARRWAGLWVPRLLATAFVAIAWFWARADRGEGLGGGPFYSAFFRNAFTPSAWVLAAAVALLAASLLVRRPFCEALCPIGAASQAADALQRRLAPGSPRTAPQAAARELAPPHEAPAADRKDRRVFLRRSLAGCGAALLGAEAVRELALRSTEPGLAMGFRNDAPAGLGPFSRPASWAIARGNLVQCVLCPHACILGENDRGFCRTRVVKNGALHTVGYGNLCAVHLDPIEKKPLYHYLPHTPILSVAIGGCNLRCLNCQNWEISQKRPEDVEVREALPADLVATAEKSRVPALAYTYSEPLMAFEYVRDSAALARERGVKNVLVTAGYINEKPLRELCRVLDAVTLDVKAFRESFYKQVSGGRLAPVLRTLEVLREEKVWTEVSFLMVPSLSDSPAEIADFAAWVAKNLGRGTPLHILRFHPAHRLEHLAPTPVSAMEEARRRSMDAGLQFVYLGNVPGNEGNHTHCPRDGRVLIERHGYDVKRTELVEGRCPCGEPIAGVWT